MSLGDGGHAGICCLIVCGSGPSLGAPGALVAISLGVDTPGPFPPARLPSMPRYPPADRAREAAHEPSRPHPLPGGEGLWLLGVCHSG